jgi:hypothetical protein
MGSKLITTQALKDQDYDGIATKSIRMYRADQEGAGKVKVNGASNAFSLREDG